MFRMDLKIERLRRRTHLRGFGRNISWLASVMQSGLRARAPARCATPTRSVSQLWRVGMLSTTAYLSPSAWLLLRLSTQSEFTVPAAAFSGSANCKTNKQTILLNNAVWEWGEMQWRSQLLLKGVSYSLYIMNLIQNTQQTAIEVQP